MASFALYRDFDLPWTPSAEDERRLRRVLGAVLGIGIAFGVVIPLLPERPLPSPPVAAPVRVVEFLIERPVPPPEPPPAIEVPTPQVETPVVRPVPAPRSQPQVPPQAQPRPDPRQKAASSGLLALSGQLTELRTREIATGTATRAVDERAGEQAHVERALLTAKVGAGSGGITVSATSSGFGGGPTGLQGHATAPVAAAPSAAPARDDVERSGRSSKGSRTREEVELIFDRNKAAIHALYSRALRDNPALQGKVVLEVTIAPSGEVTDCRIVSSELNDAELERKLVARVRMFRFEPRDVAIMTTTKPIEFFPA